MPADPRRWEQSQDAIEKRFEDIFKMLAPLDSPRPTDGPSAIAMLQELWDRLNPRGK